MKTSNTWNTLVAGLMLSLGPVAAAQVAEGLIGHWRLDESSGTAAQDSVSGSEGTLQNFSLGADSGWTNGMLGGGLAFDGVDDYVSTPLLPPTGSSPRTIAYWAKTGSANYMSAASYGGGEESYGRSFRTGFNCYNGYRGVAIDVSGAVIAYAAEINADVWHHYAWVLPAGATNIRDVKVYMDGVQLTQVAVAYYYYSGAVNTLSATPLVIGRYLVPRNLWSFMGVLDDVRVYDRGLTDSGITELYQYREVPPNLAPVADAGTDVVINSADQSLTIIQGTASDPDGDALQYRWLEADAELATWADVVNSAAPLNLGTMPAFPLGDHPSPWK